MLRILLALLILCSPLSAGQCNIGAVRSNVVYNKAAVVHQAAYVAPVVALQQVYPYTYWTVGQNIREQAESAIRQAETRKIFREEMQQLRKELLQMSKTGTPQDPEQQKALGLQVLEQSCMKCHQPTSKAVAEQGASIIFDEHGAFVASPEVRGSIGTVVKKGIMPPLPSEPLSDDDYIAIKTFLKQQ